MKVYATTGDFVVRELRTLELSSAANTKEFIRTQQSDGSWSDIDYLSENESAWAVVEHLSRIRATSSHLEVEESSDACRRGLEYWFSKERHNGN